MCTSFFFLTVRTYKTSQTKFNLFLFTTPLYKNLFPVCSIYHIMNNIIILEMKYIYFLHVPKMYDMCMCIILQIYVYIYNQIHPYYLLEPLPRRGGEVVNCFNRDGFLIFTRALTSCKRACISARRLFKEL